MKKTMQFNCVKILSEFKFCLQLTTFLVLFPIMQKSVKNSTNNWVQVFLHR